jgi:hypothetical protein
MEIKTVTELPDVLKADTKAIDEGVLRVTLKFLLSGGLTEVAAIEYTKQLINQDFFREFPSKQ